MIYIAMAKDTQILDIDLNDTRIPKDPSEFLYCHANLNHARIAIQNIDRMILLNFDETVISEQDVKNFLRSTYFSSGLYDKDDVATLSTLKVFNLSDLGITKAIELPDEDFENDSDDSIRNFIERHTEHSTDNPKSDFIKGTIKEPLAQSIDETSFSDFEYEFPIDGFVINKMDLTKLKESIGNEPVFFYAIFGIPFILLKILSELGNIHFYRWSYLLGDKLPYNMIHEKQFKMFYEFSSSIEKPFTNLNFHVPSNLLDIFRKEPSRFGKRRKVVQDQFYSEISAVIAGSTRLVILIGKDDLIVKYLLEELETKYGVFLRQNGETAVADDCLSADRIFISSADKLNATLYNQLMHKAYLGYQQNNFVILQGEEALEYIFDPNFKVIQLPTREKLEKYLPKLLLFITKKVFGDKTKDDLEIEVVSNFHKPVVLDIFKRLPTLTAIERELLALKNELTFSSYNFADQVFWWEFKNYIDEKYPSSGKAISNDKSYEEAETIDLTENDDDLPDDCPTIILTHADKAEKWVVRFEGFDVAIFQKNYKAIYQKDFKGVFIEEFRELYNILPLKYLAYLVKYCNNPYGENSRKISAEELYYTVREWNQTKKKIINKPTANTIQTQIDGYFSPKADRNIYKRDDYMKARELKKIKVTDFRHQLGILLSEHLVIQKECYYDSKKAIRIIVNDRDSRFPK